MSACNGCRALRKGCNDKCVLRHCLNWIGTPQAQANATAFVAKYFGRVTLMSFISSIHEDQRPVLFESLLYEAVGRTVNPVGGAVGLLGSGKWDVCHAAVETVLRLGASGLFRESTAGGAAKARFTGRRRFKKKPVILVNHNNAVRDNENESPVHLTPSSPDYNNNNNLEERSRKTKLLKLFI